LSRERLDISLPPVGRLAVVGAGLLMLVMIGLLVAQLAILSDSREHIQAQDRKINRIVKGTDPVLDELEPAAEDARGVLRQAQPVLREAGPVLREAGPVLRQVEPFVRDLRATMIPLLRELNGGEFVRLVHQGNELIDALRASEFIPRTLRAADLAPEAFRVATEVLEVQRATLRTQRRTLVTQRQTRAVQKETRAIQRETLDVQKRLLAIQEEALVHIRSIDRKTGGTAPATGAPVPVPKR